MGLVHRPPFVGRCGEASGEQEPFVFAEAGDFSQKSFHAQPFFFHLTKPMCRRRESQRGGRFWKRLTVIAGIHIIPCMKTITINVSDPVYRDFSKYAKQVGNTASELIRRAMEDYHERFILRKTTLRNRRPASVGGPVQPIGREEDLLGEMLDASRD